MKFFLVGPGKVGISCSSLLVKAGHELVGCFSRSKQGCRRLKEHLGSSACSLEVPDSISEVDFVLVTTPEPTLSEMGRMLARSGHLKPGQVIFHMSGVCTSRLLGEALGPEIFTGSIHPIQAVASIEAGVRLLQHSAFTIEGDEAAVEMGYRLVEDMGGKPYRLSPESKPLYHGALVAASNFMVLLGWISWKMLRAAGVDDIHSREFLMGIMKGTLLNLKEMGPEEALTGPVLRGDWQTIEKHIRALETDFPDGLNFYNTGSALLLEIARARGEAPVDGLDRIESLLLNPRGRGEDQDDI